MTAQPEDLQPEDLQPEDLQPVEDAPVALGEIPVFLFGRGLLLISLMLSSALGLHFYLGVRLIDPLGLPEPVALAAWLVLWGAYATIPVGLFLWRSLPRVVAGRVHWVAFLWMGAFGLLVGATAFSDLVLWAAARVVTPTGAWRHLQALVVLGTTIPALVLAFRGAHGTPAVERLTVRVKGLGEGLDGFKIVQLSDLHIGETLGRDFLERVVAQVNALEPDMVAVTGDVVDGTVEALRWAVEPLSRLAGKHGNFYVTGNHEYYHGCHAWEAEAQRLGLIVLHNEHRVLEQRGAKLVIAGVTDFDGARFAASHAPDADAAFANAPAEAPRILLAHQPRFARKVSGHDVALQLSGHTHGGQMFPYRFLVRIQQPVIAGFKLLWGVPVYTSRGTGYWGPPFRLGPTSEISEITLRAE